MSAPEHIAERWFDAFNRHQLEDLLALYHEDAEHFSPKLRDRYPETLGLVRGKAALRAWWQDAFERLPSLRYQPTNIMALPDTVFMEYLRHVDHEPILRVGEVLEIRNGLIVVSRVYHG